MVTLGRRVDTLRVKLQYGATFTTTLRAEDGDWPTGARIWLEFDAGVNWAATLTGTDATWAISSEDVSALIDLNPRDVELWYSDPVVDVCWAAGRVEFRK